LTKMTFSAQLDILQRSTHRFLRSCGKSGDLSDLGEDEFFSFSLYIRNSGCRDYHWQLASVQIDGQEPRHWSAGTASAAKRVRLYITHRNMVPFLTTGTHQVVWYLDGREVHRQQFVITQSADWSRRFPIPTQAEIAAYRNPGKHRSPYIGAWLQIPPETRYSEYQIDFRVGHLPIGTYCCLGNWHMDDSALRSRFSSVECGWVHGYAGFQRIDTGETVSIMSFWDIFCRNAAGRKITLSAKRLYPDQVIGGGRFWGEGTGERGTRPFDWEANHWYRMHLKCIPGKDSTIVEQWVHDLETGTQTMLCRYATVLPDSAFHGNIAVFLENYLWETAGQVRSMEVRNAQYRDAATKQWHPITEVQIDSRGGLPDYEGSYNFGVSGNCAWMITSGVGGDWFHNGKGKPPTTFSLK